MRNYEMVLMALKSGETKTTADLKAELPGLEWWNMHKYVARAKYLAGAEIELMKAGKPLKAARARDAETLRLVNADKFKSWSPVTKTGGPLFRKANPKAKTQKAPRAVPKVKAAKPPKPAKPTKTKIPPAIQAKLNAQHAKSNSLIAAAVARDPWLGRRARVTPEATNLVNPVAAPDQPGHGEVKGANVVDMIKAELAATAPKGTKKAAALPRGPKATPAPAPVKVERVSNEVTPLSDDPLDIPDFLRIKSTKTEE